NTIKDGELKPDPSRKDCFTGYTFGMTTLVAEFKCAGWMSGGMAMAHRLYQWVKGKTTLTYGDGTHKDINVIATWHPDPGLGGSGEANEWLLEIKGTVLLGAYKLSTGDAPGIERPIYCKQFHPSSAGDWPPNVVFDYDFKTCVGFPMNK